VYSFFGQTIRNQVAGLSSEMSGVDSTAQITAAKASAVDATNVAKEDYNLGNYNEAANKSAAGN
jgi:hypothetical protein